MQAQAQAQGQGQTATPGTADAPKPSIMQNPKVLIGIIAGAIVVVIAVVAIMMMSGSGGGAADTTNTTVAAGAPSSGNGPIPASAGAVSEGAGLNPNAAAGATAPTPAPMGNAPAVMPGGSAPAAGAGAPGGAAKPKEGAGHLPPGLKGRANPFKLNGELAKKQKEYDERMARIMEGLTADYSMPPQQSLYAELHTPKPSDDGASEVGEPPVPPMRVSAILRGDVVSALIQIGNQFFQVTPGKRIPDNNPVYRVERIENDKVVLSRRYQAYDKTKVQTIDVPLAVGGTAAAPGFRSQFGGGGFGGGNAPGRGGNGPR